MALQSMFQATAGRFLKNIGMISDTNAQSLTTDTYGRVIVTPLSISDHGAADEGSYFVGSAGVAASNAVMPLGPATSVPGDTTPFFLMMNTNLPGGPIIWLKRVYGLLSGTQTSETSLTIQGQLDVGLLYSSAGTALTFKNLNPNGKSSGAVAYFGAPVKAAKTINVIYCARSNPRSTIPVVGDEFIWKAGATSGPSSFISSTAGATRQVLDLGAVMIPPGWTFSLHAAFGATSTGAPAIEMETGHIER